MIFKNYWWNENYYWGKCIKINSEVVQDYKVYVHLYIIKKICTIL